MAKYYTFDYEVKVIASITIRADSNEEAEEAIKSLDLLDGSFGDDCDIGISQPKIELVDLTDDEPDYPYLQADGAYSYWVNPDEDEEEDEEEE